jgi:hypothetical protein
MEHAEIRSKEQSKAERYLRNAGYKVGGNVDAKQDARMVASGVHQHERHMHKGEAPTALKLKSGGEVKGKEPKTRLDKFARGGRTKSGPSKINIVIATGKDQPQPVPVPIPRPVPVGAGAPPPAAPAMAPGLMGSGMPPVGAPAIPPRPGMKRGGAVRYGIPDDSGAGGGEGRLEKAGMDDRIKVKGYTRRKVGGRV